MNAVLTIAGREIRDCLRNRWVAALIALLAILALGLHLLGSVPGGSIKASAMSVAVVSLAALSVYLLPLISLMLSFDAVVGESERGTLLLLLTYPVKRWQIIAGKYIGHAAILLIAILAGYGGTGLLIGFTSASGWRDAQAYSWMMASSWVLGCIFVGLGYFISVIVRERAAAVAAAISLWLLLVVFYDLGLLGLAVADHGRHVGERAFSMLLVMNPTDAYRLLNLTGTSAVSRAAGMLGLPTTGGAATCVQLSVLAFWVLAPVSLAAWLLHRREL